MCSKDPLGTRAYIFVMAALQTIGFCDRASWANYEVREKTNKMQQLDAYYQHYLNIFRASLCPSSGDQDVCYCTWCVALVLLDVVGSGCGVQHTMCSNTRLGLLKMGIMMPETCWESIDNKHLTVASCWFSISFHKIKGISNTKFCLKPMIVLSSYLYLCLFYVAFSFVHMMRRRMKSW